MPLIPNNDPEALAELLGYLGEIGYGELYLRRPAAVAEAAEELGAPAMPAIPAVPEALERSAADAGRNERRAADARAVGELAAAARQAAAAPGTAAAPDGVGTAAATGAGEDDPAARAAALAAVGAAVAACRRCRLCEGRQKTVFGAGDPNADLMFIGEGPGAEEDRQGLPFVGRAGELLTRIVEAMGLTREQVYIANIVKCRPPGNRDPQPDEVAACRSYLERQIALVRPRLLVALGRIAAQTLLGNDLPIGRMRGQWFEVMRVPLMVTYHPAALLRNPALKRPTWEDMQQVRDRLQAGGG
ncbi:MAG TPA: uracil-DNA glycosylase [Thermoanaerobaculia bacterium]|nr:uracil-DNA glycosylase [Thermoanaerobaculia bacterium]